MDHPRLEALATFYDAPGGICPFMSRRNARFALVPALYADHDIATPLLEFVQSGEPLALVYVWENEPADEQAAAKALFGDLLRILVEDEHLISVDRAQLAEELDAAFAPGSPVHPHLGYRGKGLYSIFMGPNATSRYAPCSSMVLTRMDEVAAVPAMLARSIQQEAARRYGCPYDANGLFIGPCKT